MRKNKILLCLSSICALSELPLLVGCSNPSPVDPIGSIEIEPKDKQVVLDKGVKNNTFIFKLNNINKDDFNLDNPVEIINKTKNNNKFIAVIENYSFDKELCVKIGFNNKNILVSENVICFDLKFNLKNKTIQIADFSLTYTPTDEESNYAKWDAYADTYQKDFYDNISYTYHNWYDTSVNFHISSEAEAIFLWAYAPGYDGWNKWLHADKGDTTKHLDTELTETLMLNGPSPVSPYDRYTRIDRTGELRLKDYKYLESALNKATAGIQVVSYHGFETDEVELREFIETNLGVDIEKDVPSSSIPINNLVGKEYQDYGFLATATEQSNAMLWVENNVEDKYKIVPYLEITIPPEAKCAYISYSKKMYFDNVFLSWPGEFQMLVQRGAYLKVNSVRWDKTTTKKRDILRMCCELSFK